MHCGSGGASDTRLVHEASVSQVDHAVGPGGVAGLVGDEQQRAATPAAAARSARARSARGHSGDAVRRPPTPPSRRRSRRPYVTRLLPPPAAVGCPNSHACGIAAPHLSPGAVAGSPDEPATLPRGVTWRATRCSARETSLAITVTDRQTPTLDTEYSSRQVQAYRVSARGTIPGMVTIRSRPRFGLQ